MDSLLWEATDDEKEPLKEAIRYFEAVFGGDYLSRKMRSAEYNDVDAPFERGSPAWGFYVLLFYLPHRSLHDGRQPLLPRGVGAIEYCVRQRLVCARCHVAGTKAHLRQLHNCGGCSEAAYCSPDCQREHLVQCKGAAYPLVDRNVEISGLVSRPELNGQTGTAFKYYTAKGRYGVLVNGEKVSIKPANLRLKVRTLSKTARKREVQDPVVPIVVSDMLGMAVQSCANYKCGVIGVVAGASSARSAMKKNAVLLLCGNCREAAYCSRECQKAHYKWHKKNCAVAKNMVALEKFFRKDKRANSMLRSFAADDAGGMNKRRLILFKCPDTTTIEKLADKEALKKNDIAVDIQQIPIEDLRMQLRALEHDPGDNQMWKVAMDATEIYDISKQISMAVSAPGKGGELFVKHMLIPRMDVKK
jgi:hypothetical protein